MSEIDFAAGGYPGQAYHDLLDGLREEAPVVPVRFGGEPAWLITRHAILAEAIRDSERFPQGPAYRRHTEPPIGRSFISMDEPDHQIYRRLATPTFRPIAVARADRGPMVELAHELIDAFEGESSVDLMEGFARRFPLAIICNMLGIPREAEGDFQRWSNGLLSFPFDPEGARRAGQEFTAYLEPLVRERRRAPRGDVLSQLLVAEVEGRRLTDEEVLSHIRLLFPTGAETTSSAIGNLLYALLADGARWKRAIEKPASREAAIEELLRWESPVGITPRVSAAKAIELAGVAIPADAWVLFCFAAANHDPRAYRNPHRYDPERDGDRDAGHLLTFGPGPRQCPGMHIARKELAVTLDVFCERLPGMRLIDEAAARPTGTVLRRPGSLRVELRAR
ncbi:cytochrome P450 [Myxococcota bacterium]|nr:cytochrome P450 [Myxococcota bacterium]